MRKPRNFKAHTPTEIRTLNLLLRRQTPYPLGHGGSIPAWSEAQYQYEGFFVPAHRSVCPALLPGEVID